MFTDHHVPGTLLSNEECNSGMSPIMTIMLFRINKQADHLWSEINPLLTQWLIQQFKICHQLIFIVFNKTNHLGITTVMTSRRWQFNFPFFHNTNGTVEYI